MATQITELPAVPSRNSSPDTFADDADQFLGALPLFRSEVNILATEAEADALTASNAATTATTQAGIATTQANNAAASAISAVNAPGTSATSTTSITIGTGSKSLTVQTGKAFVVGQYVTIARTSAPTTTNMFGQITAYTPGTGDLVINITTIAGSGTFTDWTIGLSAPTIDNLPFSSITSTPTTLAGYGITDAQATGTAVLLTGDQSIAGIKTFTSPPIYDDNIQVISVNTTAVKSRTYVLTTSLTLTLPASPSAGWWVRVVNRSTTVTSVVNRNAQNIMGLAENMTIDDLHAGITLVFADATRGWVLV